MRSITKPPGAASIFALKEAFTIPELIVGIVLATLFTLLSVRTVIAAHQLMPGRALSVNGSVVPIAPSPASFADAIRFHRVFMEKVQAARAIYVLGGTYQTLPANASRCSAMPLSIQSLPVIDSFSAGLPMDAYGFYQSYAAQLGKMETSAPDSTDFSVTIIGVDNGHLRVTALIQVRSQAVLVADGSASVPFLLRTSRLYDIDGENLSYSFLERANVAPESGVGARHSWYRYEENRVAEEGPAVVIFPDPWLFAGQIGRAPSAALSRFVYCLPISP